MQRLDLCSHKTSGGITEGQAETHRFTGVKIHGRKRAFTLENRLSRQFHGIFTVISRYFCAHHGLPGPHQNCCVKTCWGGTGFVESKRGNSMNNPSNTTPWLIAGAKTGFSCKKQARCKGRLKNSRGFPGYIIYIYIYMFVYIYIHIMHTIWCTIYMRVFTCTCHSDFKFICIFVSAWSRGENHIRSLRQVAVPARWLIARAWT